MFNPAKSERLLILIPAYNEAGAIQQVISDVQKAVPQADVLVIDDGSSDNTAQLAEAAGAFTLKHPFNLCIGGTVQTGLKFAQQENYDLVIRIDGDGQHHAADIPKILAALQAQKADVVVCSRFLDNKPNMHIPFARLMGIRFFAHTVTLLTRHPATDTTSGFFGMNRQAIDTLATYMPQDYPEVESRIILHKSGLTTLELPACMRERAHGQSSINAWRSLYYAIKVSIAMVIAIFKDIPAAQPTENQNEHSHRAANNSHHFQSYLGVDDGSANSQTPLA